MNDFGQYTDAIQGATVTFLKSVPSSHRWEVKHLALNTLSYERIVLGTLEFVRTRSTEIINITDIVRATKVEYRTLLRAFERYLGFSPKHYLRLRQLNLIYYDVRRGNDASARLADILAAHGVTEFGRFAGHYRSLFGKLLSETYRRSHAVKSGSPL